MKIYTASFIVSFNNIDVRNDIEIHAEDQKEAEAIAAKVVHSMLSNMYYDEEEQIYVHEYVSWAKADDPKITIRIDEVYEATNRWVFTAKGEQPVPVSESKVDMQDKIV